MYMPKGGSPVKAVPKFTIENPAPDLAQIQAQATENMKALGMSPQEISEALQMQVTEVKKLMARNGTQMEILRAMTDQALNEYDWRIAKKAFDKIIQKLDDPKGYKLWEAVTAFKTVRELMKAKGKSLTSGINIQVNIGNSDNTGYSFTENKESPTEKIKVSIPKEDYMD